MATETPEGVSTLPKVSSVGLESGGGCAVLIFSMALPVVSAVATAAGLVVVAVRKVAGVAAGSNFHALGGCCFVCFCFLGRCGCSVHGFFSFSFVSVSFRCLVY